jgi:hypothetical protein
MTQHTRQHTMQAHADGGFLEMGIPHPH